ncbi:4'-phosphopantetheinyl transferase [Streptomyces armeniacus]|uniref:4'-phosphopantetheinyl transferase n=1 Tax=Streptomyces armeniacus TaxID=83291 RepID=A0A345XSB7_9ACTN|nr:4'-phosphopantetheinyl transferase superfamily protein [Streptomyces armeniacus]AXK34533.1 4'-phosphopantetheinyl transferase [Streptomyces armeniacus]
MIEEILPSIVLAEEAYDDTSRGGPGAALYPEEAEVIAKAVAQRRREFTTVRACARAALGRLGLPPAPLLPGKRGAPQWPDGIVGSMTHCEGYRAAVVSRASRSLAIGIDAEPNGPVPDGVLEAISLPSEQKWVSALSARRPEVHWDRLLFSAKESVFKTWYPQTGIELDFVEAEIEVDESERTFEARFLVPAPLIGGTHMRGFSGRWLVRDGLIVTGIHLPR